MYIQQPMAPRQFYRNPSIVSPVAEESAIPNMEEEALDDHELISFAGPPELEKTLPGYSSLAQQQIMAMTLPQDFFTHPPRWHEPPGSDLFDFNVNSFRDFESPIPVKSEHDSNELRKAFLSTLQLLRNGHPTADALYDQSKALSLPPKVEPSLTSKVESYKCPTRRIRKSRKKLDSKSRALGGLRPKKRRKRSSKQQRFKFLCAHCKEYFLAKPTWRASKGHFVLNHQCEGGTRKQFVVGKKRQTCTIYHFPRSCITFANEDDEPVMQQ